MIWESKVLIEKTCTKVYKLITYSSHYFYTTSEIKENKTLKTHILGLIFDD